MFEQDREVFTGLNGTDSRGMCRSIATRTRRQRRASRAARWRSRCSKRRP